jgi:hypothetical protein
MSVALIIIFNHRFDQNIPKLNEIYGNRFSQIYHLVPFYDGDLPNVIPVFENSFYFQGYIPQSKHILKNIDCTHFVFIGDDLILHPKINESNILTELNISENGAFLPFSWGMITKMPMEWANTFPAINSFYLEDCLLHQAPDWKSLLPKKEEAIKKLQKLGFDSGKLNLKLLKNHKNSYKYPRFKITLKEYLKLLLKRRRTPAYPLLTGYSDMFIIPKNKLDCFSEYCELFRQMRLWVEVAIPTALVLSVDELIFEKETKWKGTTYWNGINSDEMNERYEKNEFSLDKLFSSYKTNELYIHPIKLSKWDNQKINKK